MARRSSLYGRSIVNNGKFPKSPSLGNVTAEAVSDWSRVLKPLLGSSSVARSFSSSLVSSAGDGIECQGMSKCHSGFHLTETTPNTQ